MVSLASIFIVQLLFILYLKHKNTALQAKLKKLIPKSNVNILISPREGDEAEEVIECYEYLPEKDETAEENYYEIEL
jgi:hypothetical protein